MRVTWAGVRGAGGLRRAQIQGVWTKVHHRCATAAFAGFLLGSQQSKEKRVDKVFHQPAKKSLVDYESSEARIIPARQQEENPETEKRKKSFWHFGSLTKSSSGAQLYACPFQSADFQVKSAWVSFFLSLCSGISTRARESDWLVILLSGESWAFLRSPGVSACLAVVGRGEESTLLFTCELL